MDKKIEIIDKDIQAVRLTITTSRVTMKFPLNFPEDQKKTIIKVFEVIAEEYKDTTKSVRGALDLVTKTIKIEDNNDTEVKTFTVHGI